MNRGFQIFLGLLLLTCELQGTQAAQVESQTTTADPLKVLEASFPDSVQIKQKGRLLEFCPDGTCDGFVVRGSMSVATLKDFAYLYEYFFSDYTFLGEWRVKQQAKDTVVRILSKPEYRNCGNGNNIEAARCLLQELTKKGNVELIFVRYDEGERHVMHRKISEQLANGAQGRH